MMHRIIRDHLEEILAAPGSAPGHPAEKHLAECEECRDLVAAMREQAVVLRQGHAPAEETEIHPGFYARVMERIEAQTPQSVWTLFFDSLFGRRIALAALGLALLIGVYVISSEQMPEPEIAGVDGLPQATLVSAESMSVPQELPVMFPDGAFPGAAQPQMVAGAPDQDAVLVNLVTYREQ
jgi:predicted anti-sigma-YlaC factor YlaD